LARGTSHAIPKDNPPIGERREETCVGIVIPTMVLLLGRDGWVLGRMALANLVYRAVTARPMSSEPRVFIDTNVLWYLVSADTRKADRAEELLRSDRLNRCVSTQVVAEFAVNLRRKAGGNWPEIRIHIDTDETPMAQPLLM
jgi:hypothetical protein